ncbi:MAG: toll/interleukin-1 receptor domain-containing protein [Flavobacteriaceae bacterium]|nr:toll/interleukin-1 receptor domain-containing protein [Flavobacteriaceae bacterium]
MSTETIFFSYSRDDSEFVLQLAKNLRQAGANIWLDQLDISAGSRWDKSIEQVLTRSKTLLVILSKTSVTSDNVLDEVSFALEEGKTVVPVLLEDCEIPFRLRRLQYADFTENREKGIQTLIHALHLDADVASKLSDYTEKKASGIEQEEKNKIVEVDKELEKKQRPLPDNETTLKTHTEPTNKHASNVSSTQPKSSSPKAKPTQKTSAEPIKKGKAKKTIIVLLLVIVLAVGAWSSQFLLVDEDTKWFNDTLQRNTVQDFEFYISRFPEGKFIDQAHDSIYAKTSRERSKKEQELKEKESQDWENALTANNIEAYQNYINHYPNGNHIVEARQKMTVFSENIENQRQDEEAWNTSVSVGSITALLDYYTNPQLLGNHREEALQKIKETGQKGWLYCGRFSGDKMTESIFDLIWRAQDFTQKDILKPNDVVMLKANESARRTYRYADNRNTNNANQTLIEKNKKMYILAVKKEGNALIAHVIY